MPADAVRRCVEALMFLLSESSKLLVSEIDFSVSDCWRVHMHCGYVCVCVCVLFVLNAYDYVV